VLGSVEESQGVYRSKGGEESQWPIDSGQSTDHDDAANHEKLVPATVGKHGTTMGI
jgi:hypothetical protein